MQIFIAIKMFDIGASFLFVIFEKISKALGFVQFVTLFLAVKNHFRCPNHRKDPYP